METSNIDKLRKALDGWLARNELDGDLHFFTPEEWKARKGRYLDGAHLMIVFEGGLCSMMNGFICAPGLHSEFLDLVNSFGYWYERGEYWSMGFYPTEGYDYTPLKCGYAAKLTDPRWTAKRDFIKERAGRRCEDCGKASSSLEVHHCYYIYGFEPWEYPYDALRSLCRECHVKRPREEFRVRGMAARLKTNELLRIRESLQHAFYWFDMAGVLDFLRKLGPDDERNTQEFQLLLERKSEVV